MTTGPADNAVARSSGSVMIPARRITARTRAMSSRMLNGLVM
jgi:hypothetical protein